MTEQGIRRNLGLIASGIAIGALYGLFLRWGVELFPRSHFFVVMSIGFIVLLPLAVGFTAVYIIERRQMCIRDRIGSLNPGSRQKAAWRRLPAARH